MDDIRKKVAAMTPEALAQSYKNCFLTDSGKIVLENLRQKFFMRTSTAYVEDEVGRLVHVPDNVINRNEGMRLAVIHIEDMIDYQPKNEADKPQESEQ